LPAVFLSRGTVTVVKRLQSTISGQVFPFERIEEFADNGESLEVGIEGLAGARVKPGRHLWERFADFLPVAIDGDLTLGEGETPLLPAGKALSEFAGIGRLQLEKRDHEPHVELQGPGIAHHDRHGPEDGGARDGNHLDG